MDGNQTFINGHALLIGVGADLPMTVTDATGVNDILVDPQRAAYNKENVTLLTEESANRQSILNSFDDLIEKSNSNPEATVLIYYSGHGGIDRSKDDAYFLVPFGFKRSELETTAISDTEFTAKIDAIQSNKLLVFLDCCHAGGMTKDIENDFVKKSTPPDLLNALSTGSGRIVVASSRDNEYSIAENPYSVFTDCLIQALSGKGTQRADGYARVLDVLSYLFEQVPVRTDEEQHPFVNEIKDLSDNFPVSFYAGGRKSLPEGVSAPSTENFSSYSLIQLKTKLSQRQSEWELRNALIDRIRKQLAIEASIMAQFQLEQELLIRQTELSKLEAEINEIEAKLA